MFMTISSSFLHVIQFLLLINRISVWAFEKSICSRWGYSLLNEKGKISEGNFINFFFFSVHSFPTGFQLWQLEVQESSCNYGEKVSMWKKIQRWMTSLSSFRNLQSCLENPSDPFLNTDSRMKHKRQ